MIDRHRAEISFIGRIIYVLILGGVQANKKQHEDLAELALQAATEPLKNLAPNERQRIIRRVMRMEEHTIRPLSGVAHGKKILLIAYYLVNQLVEEGYLELPEGSALAQITDFLLSLIDVEDEGVQKQMISAQKQAGKWLETLRASGYYK